MYCQMHHTDGGHSSIAIRPPPPPFPSSSSAASTMQKVQPSASASATAGTLLAGSSLPLSTTTSNGWP